MLRMTDDRPPRYALSYGTDNVWKIGQGDQSKTFWKGVKTLISGLSPLGQFGLPGWGLWEG